MSLPPLAIKCTSTDCENDLHCFLQKRRPPGQARRVGGPCRACGADLVEWERVSRRDLKDVQYTFNALQNELIRHEFWHRELDPYAVNHARRKGLEKLRDSARSRIQKSVGRAKNPREGRQTPMEGNVLYYAQHAVAACCRKCIAYWHGIEEGRDLSEEEIAYLVELLMLYIMDRLPSLNQLPMHVPPIRKPNEEGKA